jgi:hypothetical protein
LLEPYVLKGASTVLKGERGRNAPDLPSENMPSAMPGIMKNVLGLDIVAVQEFKFYPFDP